MDRIVAPYNFVPLSDRVFFPDWAGQASQDVPFEDGISGTLKLRIEARTPLFVRGARDPERFFRTEDGLVAIPGSALRGMLRNVVEIASFGKLTRLNDHTYGLRDLHNHRLYVSHMAGILPTPDGRKIPMPLVGAGWLRRKGVDEEGNPVAEIRPCRFAKIEYRRLLEVARSRGVGSAFRPGERQSAVSKYRAWGGASRDVEVTVRPLREALHQGRVGEFGVVERVGGPTRGTLVFTGQPSRWDANAAPRRGGGHPKHHDFVFHGDLGATLPVPPEVLRAFRFVHSDRSQQHRSTEAPNEEWAWWKDRFDRDEPVPVFYLLHGKGPREGRLRAFGLAMMFRLAYDKSTRAAARGTQPAAWEGERPISRLDLAETLFGHVPLDARDDDDRAERSGALKGRVSIGLATPVGPVAEDAIRRVVLGAPRASYYPNYVEQGPAGTAGEVPARAEGKPDYRTFMDPDVRIRGWKRYRPQLTPANPPPPRTSTGGEARSDKIWTTFTPLKAGTVFSANVRFHNVRPAELGALLWALDFGGASDAVHLLGMARSLGYGSVRLTVDGHRCVAVKEGAPVDLAACRRTFEDTMEAWARAERIEGGWRGSRQVHELLSCAVPSPDAESVRSMLLDHPQWRNEFTAAKAEGLALRPAGAATWTRASVTERPSAPGPGAAVARPSPGGPAPAPRGAPELIVAWQAVKPHQLAGQTYAFFCHWSALPPDAPDRDLLGRRLLERIRKERPSDTRTPWFKELEAGVKR